MSATVITAAIVSMTVTPSIQELVPLKLVKWQGLIPTPAQVVANPMHLPPASKPLLFFLTVHNICEAPKWPGHSP